MSGRDCLSRLPNELLGAIAAALPTNRDVKNLRLTCKRCGDAALASLDISRVFISAHPVNIYVMREIADHEILRHKVTEIIWDDARFDSRRVDLEFVEDEDDDGEHERPHVDQDYPEWFGAAYDDNHDGGSGVDVRLRRSRIYSSNPHELVNQVEAEMPPSECWVYYRQLLKQQDEVLRETPGQDVVALKYAIDRFPQLRRIVLTPVAHGFLFMPLYHTPLIRQFPRGLNYPIPRSWPIGNRDAEAPKAPLWRSEEVKNKWRGFRIITRVLAENTSHSISEFVVDVNYLDTGLTYHVFEGANETSQEYRDLLNVVSRPGFRRLDLAILTGKAVDGENWIASTHRNLHHLLSLAELEHFSIRTNGSRRDFVVGEELNNELNSFVPLRHLLPIEAWPRLRHLSLSGMVLDVNDTLDVLLSLPSTLRTLELSHILFKKGSYKELLENMRDRLPWCSWQPRPRLILKTHWTVSISPGKTVWYSDEATRFLYGEQERLFGVKEDWGLHQVPMKRGLGGRRKDEFDPTFEWPCP